MKGLPFCFGLLGIGVMASATASAKTVRVDNYGSLEAQIYSVAPGDVIEVLGDKTYKGRLYWERAGTAEQPITIRGITVNGKRPILDGSGEDYTLQIATNHYVIENLEIVGADTRCLFHVGHDLTVRDVAIHDCPKHGLLSSDEYAGSLLLERCELYNNGEGDYHHQIYVSTNQDLHPGAVFRMQHCYVHDGRGGNNVKSRAQRNEIYFNWIEGALFHELELIGPDHTPKVESREDSDVVGNVLRKTNESHAIRVGGDGTSDTDGRYRFVNNTFLLPSKGYAPVRLFNGIESLELHNNVFYRAGGGPLELMKEQDVQWAQGSRLIWGSNNYIPRGSTAVPGELVGTISGADPKFVSLAAFDLRPAVGSPLRDAGGAARALAAAPFPKPLTQLKSQPPVRAPLKYTRGSDDAIDVGAYEGGFDLVTGQPGETAPPPASSTAEPSPSTSSPLPKTSPPVRSCACRTARGADRGGVGYATLLLLAFLSRRRWR